MIVIVSLDLLGPAAGYDALYQAIKDQGTWWHEMRWTWILDTTKTPNQIVEVLRPHVQPGDKMLVAPLGPPYQGLLTPDAWKWIIDRKPNIAVTP